MQLHARYRQYSLYYPLRYTFVQRNSNKEASRECKYANFPSNAFGVKGDFIPQRDNMGTYSVLLTCGRLGNKCIIYAATEL